ncbi:MAG: MarR family transcriptional regulator [Euryarchaeota archaeon]|nr:MarR family transcriptional regulator [Euryarchaeota archaeon]
MGGKIILAKMILLISVLSFGITLGVKLVSPVTTTTFIDFIITAVSSGLIGASASYLFFTKSEKTTEAITKPDLADVHNKQESIDAILKTLKGKEQTIINELINTGAINQSELSSRTEIPSSTLSRTLYELEQRGLIVRYYNGMSKMVKLNDSLAMDESQI